MKHYENFLKLGCFTFAEANELFNNANTTKTTLQQYVKKGYIKKIKRGLYVTVNLYDNEPVVNKFVIASKISDTAIVSHHSAFEYYGFINQVTHDVYVTSDTFFGDFEFNGIRYHHLTPQIKTGIENEHGNIRVTNIERTVLDAINDVDKVMGFEELIENLTAIPSLNENLLLSYLQEYNKKFLYQKTGFILEQLQDELFLSDAFFAECRKGIGNSFRYLMSETATKENKLSKKWQITYPLDLWDSVNYGGVN